MRTKLIAIFASFLAFAMGPSLTREALAGGYAIPYQSARAVGLSNAVTAGIDDPSAIYVNPAALTEVEGSQILGGFHYINTISSVEDRATGAKTRNRDDDLFVPHLFLSSQLPSLPLTVGLGTYAPFGLATSYNKNAFTSFAAIDTELKLFYVTPSIAWRVSPWLSIGGGVSFVHASAVLSQDVFLGVAAPHLRMTATDNGYAYNLGVLLKPVENLKFGITYRSRVDLDFNSGDVKFGAGPVTFTKLKGTQVPLPQVVSFGINWRVNPEWDMEFVYDYTRWSQFQNLKGTFETPLLGGLIPGFFLPQLWRDTNTFRFGTSYKLPKNVELRGGISFDQTPIPSSTLGPAIPGADSINLNFGLGYRWNNFTADIGYIAWFNQTRSVVNNVIPGAPSAKYSIFTNVVTLDVGYRF